MRAEPAVDGRPLADRLRPASLDELGVQPAVEALLRRASARFGLSIDANFDLGRQGTRLEGEVESTIYRLVQEAINNVVKHAGAESVYVEVVEDDGRVRVTVRDDGSGFDTGGASTGFGLIGMRERVELVDGRLFIDSTPGRGTVVRAELPDTHARGDGEASESAPRESVQG